MQKLCTNCNFIGKGKHGLLSGNIYVGIIEVVVAVIILFTGQKLLQSFIYGAVVAAIVAIAGLINIMDSFSEGRLCPNCGKDKMIPLDTPKAQVLIQEHNLTVGDNVPQNTQNDQKPDQFEAPKS
ncbi:MAG: hypothetical protein RIG61_07380 [Deltaproteobacteria bacterium]